ncbi:hypothetical protein C2R96_07145, partial [Helicobacter pylori]
GNKVFDFYSDRNFTDFRGARPQPSTSKDNGIQHITLNEPNPTTNALKTQEPLSPLEQANAEKYELILKTKHKTKL